MTDTEEYIKKYCIKERIDTETAKTHAIVREVDKYYKELERERVKNEDH